MKIRNGFVSNSSSSSFVVAIKKDDGETCPTCGRSTPNILKMLEQKGYYGGETELEGIGLDAVLEYADEICKYDDYHKNEADTIKEKAAKYGNDWELAVFSVSYHDEVMSQMIEDGISSGSIEIINKEEG